MDNISGFHPEVAGSTPVVHSIEFCLIGGSMLFKKKSNKPEKTAKTCFHKYKDFPWYVAVTNYYKDSFSERWRVDIVEPYVCVHCGDRKDMVLAQYIDFYDKKSADKAANAIKIEYADHIQDKAIVEDMVNDTILVDQQYLKFYEMVKNGRIDLPELKL